MTKTGIDVKYSTSTIEWFKNELLHCDPHDLKDRDFQAMAKIIEIQKQIFLVWIGMTQPVLQLKFLLKNMKRFQSTML